MLLQCNNYTIEVKYLWFQHLPQYYSTSNTINVAISLGANIWRMGKKTYNNMNRQDRKLLWLTCQIIVYFLKNYGFKH